MSRVGRPRIARSRFARIPRGYTARMTTFEDTPEDPLVRQEEDAAAAEAGSIGGRAPEYEDDEGDAASEADRALIEGGEGVEEGFETAENDLREAASHGENRYDPESRDFGDEESAGDADALPGEADEIDVTETVRDPDDRD